MTLVRDGHGEEVTLESVDVDFDTIVPHYIVRMSDGISTSVTKKFLRHISERDSPFIPITAEQVLE